ncbi:MAG: ATP-binding protein [Desulfobacterales bacterium]
MTSNTLTFKLRNQLSEADKLSRLLEGFAEGAGLSKGELNSINLAIEELFTNIVNYGYLDAGVHWVEVAISLEEDQVVVQVSDEGIAFNPILRSPPDTICPVEQRRIGGLGIHLCRNLMDEINYQRRGLKNIVTMKKRLGQ